MSKKMLVGILAAALLLVPMVTMADDAPPLVTPAVAADVPAPAVVVAAPAAPAVPAPVAAVADPVDDAAKKIDDAIKDIDENPAENVGAIIAAFQEGRWAVGIGLAIMFLIWVLRRFLWKLIPSSALPWLTLALGCTVTISIELVAGIVWWKTLIDGFLTSASAMALWSMIFTHVLPSGTDKEKPA